jgi:UDP-glucose 4-epimerase
MKILVTGGAGFVGTNLVKQLKDGNNDITVIDNYSAGKRENHVDGVKYIDAHTKDIDKVISEKPDLIYHLGEYSRIAPSFVEIDKVFDYNIVGSFAVVDFARRTDTPLVYAGSSTKMAQEGENHSPYSYFKSSTVQLIRNYASWYGLRYSICYFYNVYGELQDNWPSDWQTVVGVFERQWKEGKPLTVVGDGQQRRDFTYVGDIVRGLIMASQTIKNDEYQLGTGRDYSILEVAKMFSDDITFVEARPGDRKRGLANVEETFEKLGWRAQRSLESWISHVKSI